MQAVSGHTYANIVNGIVHWVFAATDLPEWADTGFTVVDITSVSPPPQVGWTAIETSGAWAFAAPAAPPAPTLAQQAAALIAGGLAITSTGTPALDATYPTNGEVWADLKDEALFIASFGVFSSGVSTLAVLLAPDGATITFTATVQVQNVVKAIAMYLSALKTIVATNAGTLPSASVTIA